MPRPANAWLASHLLWSDTATGIPATLCHSPLILLNQGEGPAGVR